MRREILAAQKAKASLRLFTLGDKGRAQIARCVRSGGWRQGARASSCTSPALPSPAPPPLPRPSDYSSITERAIDNYLDKDPISPPRPRTRLQDHGHPLRPAHALLQPLRVAGAFDDGRGGPSPTTCSRSTTTTTSRRCAAPPARPPAAAAPAWRCASARCFDSPPPAVQVKFKTVAKRIPKLSGQASGVLPPSFKGFQVRACRGRACGWDAHRVRALLMHPPLPLPPLVAPPRCRSSRRSPRRCSRTWRSTPSLRPLCFALLETVACETSQRIIAMDAASTNGAPRCPCPLPPPRTPPPPCAPPAAGDMVDRFKLIYNRARQAKITTELSEINAVRRRRPPSLRGAFAD